MNLYFDYSMNYWILPSYALQFPYIWYILCDHIFHYSVFAVLSIGSHRWREVWSPTRCCLVMLLMAQDGASLYTTLLPKQKRMYCGSYLGHSEQYRASKSSVTFKLRSAKVSDSLPWQTMMNLSWPFSPSTATLSEIVCYRSRSKLTTVNRRRKRRQ